VLVPLRGVLETLATEFTPMRGRASMSVKMTARHIGSLSEGFLTPRTLKPLDAKVRCLNVSLDQVLFGRVVAWHGAAILHSLPCAAPWCLTPIGALFNMSKPLPRIILDGELDDLELDARWREIFTVGALFKAFLGLGLGK